jgi:3-phosphoshikimate 1-carboxyvinyltransferase
MDHREGIAQYAVHGGTFRGGHVIVHAEKSSQFASSLLLSAPGTDQGLTLQIAGTIASAPYLAMSLEVMKAFGVEVKTSGSTWNVAPGSRYRPAIFDVEPDASGATYAFGAAAITGGEVTVKGLKLGTLQSDAGVLDVLAKMGCSVMWQPDRVTVRRTGDLCGIEVDMNRMPDAVPTLVAVSLFASSPTRIVNVAHLRYKESDRLGTLADELRQLGASIEVLDDGMTITPATLTGALLDAHEDHRLAMSFGLIGLRVPGITINGPDCVSKSFPRFWEELENLTCRKPSGLA